MNKVYKVIWSKVKNCYVVASELAKSHTKAPKSGVMSRALVAGVLACVLSCGAVMPVYATDYTAGGGSVENVGRDWDRIAIGKGANAYADGNAIAIGAYSFAGGVNSLAIGYGAIAGARTSGSNNCVALGYDSAVGAFDGAVVSVGHIANGVYYDDNSNLKTYDSDLFRRIINVADGMDAHDVVTVGQMQSYVAANAGSYTLPAATSSKLGGVKIGSNITNSNGTISLTKANVTAALGYTPPTSDTNTHYTTHLYAGSGTAANAATTNGNTKIALTDDSTVRNTLTIKGAGKTTVTSDANGVITITSTDANTTYNAFTGASSSAAGSAGLVKAPAAGDQAKFLRGDGTWAADNDTHWTSHMYVGTGAAANAATTNGNTKIALTDNSTVRNTLTIKGTGATTVTSDANGVITINSTDNNTTYSAATQSANGLMTAADKKKLDGIASGANAYSLPTATDSVLGGVKVGSNLTNTNGTISLTKANVTAALGYTPPTQDTNTTYDNMSASELTTGTATTARSISAKVISDYVAGKVSDEVTARNTAINTAVSTETTNRTNADTALGTRIDNAVSAYQSADTGLSNRIGSLVSDGNYIKKADTNNVSENLTVLDTQLKSLEDRLGSATVAEGSTGSTSIGDGSGVNGDNSVSIGDGSGVTGDNSVAIGADASTNESDTVAVGGGSSASGEGSTSLGAGTSASGTGSTSLGNNAYSSGNGSVALGNDSVAGIDSVVSVGHKVGDTDAQGNTYVTNEFRRIINVANGVDANDAATVGQMNTAINVETSARTVADTALSDRIGTLTADGNYIKKSDTNNVSQNLTVLDTELKTLADRIGFSTVSDGSTGSTAMGDGSEVTGNNSVGVGDNSKVTGDDSVSVGTGSSVEGNDGVSLGNDSSVTGDGSVSIGSGTTVDGDNSVGIGKDSEVTANNGIALGSEASSTEAGAIAIGSGSSASGVNATSLGTDAEASGNHSTALGDGANAFGDSSISLGSNSVAGTDGVVSVGHKAGDLDVTGNTYTTNEFRRIINVANGVDDNDAVTVGQMNQQLATINNYNTTLDARIGTIASDGNYIRSSATNDVAANLMALDTQLKATDVSSLKYDGVDHSLVTMGGTNGTVLRNVKSGVVNETSMEAVNGSQLYSVKQDITGFASDIQANATNIDALNSSVTAALSSVSASGLLVDSLDSSKADKSLSNLSDAGKRVLKTYAEDAVATYLAGQGLSIPAAPMAMNNGTVSNGNTLSITNAGNGSLHVGEGSYVNGTSSIAIGVGNQVNANNSGAFGDPSIINADASYVLGNDDTINTGATGSFIVGNDGVSDAKGGLLFGSNTKATVDAEDGMALGNRAEVSAKNAIALGSGSIADADNTLSIGNTNLKRKIVNVADGDISQNSNEAVTGAQLFLTNEKVQQNTEALAKKADVDGGNINTSDWATKLGIGKIEDGNTDLVTGGTVYDAIKSINTDNGLIQTNGDTITIGANSTATTIDVSGTNGQGRAITGVITDVNDASSATNVGYVNAVGENIIREANKAFQRVDTKINKVGANAAAIASLPTPTFDGDEKWAFSAGVGHYHGETAASAGAFYKPQDNVIVRVGGSFGNGDEMVGAGVSVSLNKGNTPAVSKAQLVRTINAQANEIQGLKAGREADRAEIAELKAMVADLAAKVK